MELCEFEYLTTLRTEVTQLPTGVEVSELYAPPIGSMWCACCGQYEIGWLGGCTSCCTIQGSTLCSDTFINCKLSML